MDGTEQAPQVPGYEVLDPLGQGASATVWRARRLGDGLVVALKVITPAGGDVAAGLREAGLLAGVRHRHVVRLYDVLPLPDPVSGRPTALALATQLAGGGSLAQVLARRRILSPGELVTALQPVAGALADLHEQGVVHGDLSTGNVLFLRDGMPLLADLGAARVAGAPPGEAQGTGALSGLVAPEVVEGFAATRESDVYQLGAVAWLCLAGEPPGPPWSRRALDELVPGLPPGLPDLVTRCLAPEPGDRPDAEEVALALLATATPEPVEVAPDADPGHGLTERLRRQARDDLGPELEERPRRRWGRRGTHRPERVRDPASARRRRASAALQVGRRRRLVPTVVVLVTLLLAGAAAALLHLGPGAGDRARGGGPEPVAAATAPSPPRQPAPQQPPPPTAAPTAAPPATAGSTDAGDDQRSAEGTGGKGQEAPLVDIDDATLRQRLQDLVDGRAEAWRRGDAALLGGVLADGSPALRSETAALATAVDQGMTYPDLAFRVEDAALTGGQAGRVTVDAVVVRERLSGLDAEGTVVVDEPATTESVRLVLTRGDGRDPWRLWSWEPG